MQQQQASCSNMNLVATSNIYLATSGCIHNNQQQASGSCKQEVPANKRQQQRGSGNEVVTLAIGSNKQLVAASKRQQQARDSSKQVIAASKLLQQAYCSNYYVLPCKKVVSHWVAANKQQQQASGSKKKAVNASKRHQQVHLLVPLNKQAVVYRLAKFVI